MKKKKNTDIVAATRRQMSFAEKNKIVPLQQDGKSLSVIYNTAGRSRNFDPLAVARYNQLRAVDASPKTGDLL